MFIQETQIFKRHSQIELIRQNIVNELYLQPFRISAGIFCEHFYVTALHEGDGLNNRGYHWKPPCQRNSMISYQS